MDGIKKILMRILTCFIIQFRYYYFDLLFWISYWADLSLLRYELDYFLHVTALMTRLRATVHCWTLYSCATRLELIRGRVFIWSELQQNFLHNLRENTWESKTLNKSIKVELWMTWNKFGSFYGLLWVENVIITCVFCLHILCLPSV